MSSLADGLVTHGDAVAVVSRRTANEDDLQLVIERPSEDLAVYRLAGGRLSPDRFLAHDERLERLFMLALLEANPDIVHVAHLYGLPPRLVAIAKRLRIPVVTTLLDHYFECPLLHLLKLSGEPCAGPDGGRECAATCFAYEREPDRWELRYDYFRLLLGLADRVLCPARRVAARFEAFAPDAGPIQVVPLGIPIEAGAPNDGRPRTPGPIRLAYMGSVVPHKGVHVVVEAAAAAGIPVAIDVLGRVYDSAYGEELTRRADGAPQVQVRLHGRYEDDDVARLLSDVDAVVMPSQVPEVYPLAAYEALAYGVPLLVGTLGGLPEAVDDGTNGFTFDASRPDELAAILRRLHDDRALLARLRAGAASTKTITNEAHVNAMRAVYEEVVHAGPPDESALAEFEALHGRLQAAGFGRNY